MFGRMSAVKATIDSGCHSDTLRAVRLERTTDATNDCRPWLSVKRSMMSDVSPYLTVRSTIPRMFSCITDCKNSHFYWKDKMVGNHVF